MLMLRQLFANHKNVTGTLSTPPLFLYGIRALLFGVPDLVNDHSADVSCSPPCTKIPVAWVFSVTTQPGLYELR